MNRLLAFLLSLTLAACASVPPVHVDLPDMAHSESVQLRDARPPTESKQEIMSLLITSDAYGVIRNGDIHSEPPPLRVIQHRVFEHMGPQAHVTVHHFVSYRNLQSQLRAGALGSILGPIGAAIGSASYNGTTALSATLVDRAQFDAMTGDDEWKRGLYSAGEDPNKVSVFVTFLDLEVDGRRAFVRVVSPVQADDGKNSFLIATEATIQEALKQLEAAPVAQAGVPATAAATTTAAVPVAPVVPATVTPSADARPVTERPPGTRHLDMAAVDGKTLTYQHVRDPAAYGNVRVVFSGDRVDASNAKSKTTGHYTVENDLLCMTFDSTHWNRFCVYVLDTAGGTQVMFMPGGSTIAGTLQ
jgi:hypothetical protein